MNNFKHFAVSFLLLTACGQQPLPSTQQEAWNDANNPSRFNLVQQNINAIAHQGRISSERFPWSDDYWATYSGGISRRWQRPVEHPNEHNYKQYQYDVLDRYSVNFQDVATLSPAEKYDLYLGKYEFPLTQYEKKRTLAAVDRRKDAVPTWFGLCHGWAPATLAEPEAGPQAVVKNPNGLEIPFYSSDIKALIIAIYANFKSQQGTQFVGERCNLKSNEIPMDGSGRLTATECRDTNPATLHLALSQFLGNADASQNRGFVMDRQYEAEVWNQPVVGYKILSQDIVPYNPATDAHAKYRAPGTAKLAQVALSIEYVTEIEPNRAPSHTDGEDYTNKIDVEYTLELDANDMIIGGEWVSTDRPDFLWNELGTPVTADSYLSYDIVKDLLNKSLGQ